MARFNRNYSWAELMHRVSVIGKHSGSQKLMGVYGALVFAGLAIPGFFVIATSTPRRARQRRTAPSPPGRVAIVCHRQPFPSP
jgi:hypothetical protein